MTTAPLTPVEELGDALFWAAVTFALSWGAQMLARREAGSPAKGVVRCAYCNDGTPAVRVTDHGTPICFDEHTAPGPNHPSGVPA